MCIISKQYFVGKENKFSFSTFEQVAPSPYPTPHGDFQHKERIIIFLEGGGGERNSEKNVCRAWKDKINCLQTRYA